MLIPMTGLRKPPLVIVSELRRELRVRKSIYPAWERSKRLSAFDAAHRVAALEDALAVVEAFFAEELKTAQGDMLTNAQ